MLIMWSRSYRMFELRSSIMKDCKDPEEIKMTQDEFYTFETLNSDTRLHMVEVRAGMAPQPHGREIYVEIPLTYCEEVGIDEFFDEQIIENTGVYMPSDIFDSKYADALSALGMDILYSSFCHKADDFNDSEFASVNNIFLDGESAYDAIFDFILPNQLCILVKNCISDMKKFKKKKKKKRKKSEHNEKE